MKTKAVNPAGAGPGLLVGSLILCFFGFLLSGTICGLDRDRTITQFHHTSWTVKEGAPEQVRALAQTGDGYLWLGTLSGLYRFDGIQFEPYEPQSGGSFLSGEIVCLLAAPGGGLWIGYRNGGVGFLKDGHLTNYGEPEGLPPGTVFNFASDDEGAVWAATAGGLARFENSRWQIIGPERNYPGKFTNTVFIDRRGTVWAAAEDTVLFLPKGARAFQPTGEKVGKVFQIAEAPDGSIWLAEMSRAVRQLALPGIEPRSLGPEVQVGSFSLLFDREGALFVTSVGDGIRRVPYTDRYRGQKIAQFSTKAEIFTEQDGLSSDYMFTVFEDREGNIWTGTANGLDRFRNSPLISVRFPPGEVGFGMVAGDDGEVFIFSRSLWLIRRRDTAPTKIRTDNEGWITFRDSEGALWVDGHDVIWGINEDGSTKTKLALPVKNARITQIFKDSGERLWVYCAGDGLFRLKDGVWEKYEKQPELPKSYPLAKTLIDPADRIWFGYADNLVTVIDGERIRTFTGDDGLQVGDVKTIYERGGRIWAAGTRGVALFENDRFRMLAAENVEDLSGVSGLVETGDGSLWLNAARGVVYIPEGEVRRAIEDPAYKVHCRIFDFLDGLPGTGQQGRPFPTVIEGSDGRLWFSTNKGIAWVDPRNIPGDFVPPPPVIIRLITANERSYAPVSSLKLPEGTTGLAIDFTALSLSVPERIRFRYKLEPVDSDWQEAGTRRQAFYNSLGPGQYRFHVIASNGDGVWDETGAAFDFTIEPVFYQTIWFRSAVFLLALILAVGVGRLLYIWRIAQTTRRLNAAFEERLAERSRISQELHDTLLQGFLGITMRLQSISNLLPSKAVEARENLEDVLEKADTVLREGRRAIWNVHPSGVKEHDLVRAFTLVVEELNDFYPTDFILTTEGESVPLHPLVRDDVYRIGREALTNAFRHAKATKIELGIEYSAKRLRVFIRDNGRGINPDYLSAGRAGHLGLSGMRDNAEKIGAELKIRSREQCGTEVELLVPHQIAFVKKTSDNLFQRLFRLSGRKTAFEKKNNQE
jgi:signal transduction histidine kinase/ligand-binding sensor domain-containing protein